MAEVDSISATIYTKNFIFQLVMDIHLLKRSVRGILEKMIFSLSTIVMHEGSILVPKTKRVKIFLQVNIGDESQKSGIKKNDLDKLVYYCKEIKLDIIGLMCIPPANIDPEYYFKEMQQLNKNYDFKELSMGMSSDYIQAAKTCQLTLELDLVFLARDFRKFLFSFFFLLILT